MVCKTTHICSLPPITFLVTAPTSLCIDSMKARQATWLSLEHVKHFTAVLSKVTTNPSPSWDHNLSHFFQCPATQIASFMPMCSLFIFYSVALIFSYCNILISFIYCLLSIHHFLWNMNSTRTRKHLVSALLYIHRSRNSLTNINNNVVLVYNRQFLNNFIEVYNIHAEIQPFQVYSSMTILVNLQRYASNNHKSVSHHFHYIK